MESYLSIYSLIVYAFGVLSINEKCFPNLKKNKKQKTNHRASLVAQWLRVCLLMQGTRVRALAWEDPTCRGATRPMSHNY